MPLLKISSIEPEKVCEISKVLVDELEQQLQCPREYFTLEVLHTTVIKDGKIIKGSPVIEVSWFDRGQKTQDIVAAIITKHVQSLGYPNVDVIFRTLDKSKYYENGTHF